MASTKESLLIKLSKPMISTFLHILLCVIDLVIMMHMFTEIHVF